LPELPEVETLVSELAPEMVGRRITEVILHWRGCVAELDPDVFCQQLTGETVVQVTRRGKYLVFRLESGQTLLIHLRMTGRLEIHGGRPQPHPHTRLVLRLDDGRYLHFQDQRKFGRVYLVADTAHILSRLGPEPLDDAFTDNVLVATLSGRKASIKALLLNQRLIAGLGNIYADEALFRAGIDPRKPGGNLTREEVKRLCAAIRETLMAAIMARGTTLSDYRQANGSEGNFQKQLRVFRRENQPCPRCGTPIQRIRLVQRSTYFCPHCQT